jgi:hypothetical protein
LRALEKIEIHSFTERITYQMMRADVQRCKEGRLSDCHVTTKVGRSPAFILDDGTMIAARHGFLEEGKGLLLKFAGLAQDWARDLEIPSEVARVNQDIETFKRNPLHDLMFILTDAEDRVVFNSALQGFRVLRFGFLAQPRGVVNLESRTVELERHDPKLATYDFSSVEWIYGDGVRIQLSATLPSLKQGSAKSCMAGRAAIAGYAGITTSSRASLGFRDAVQDELSVTMGGFLTFEESVPRITNWDKGEQFKTEAGGRDLLLTDSDATEGLSGGPILNSRGEVCGMLRAMFPGNEKLYFNPGTHLYHLITFGIPLKYLSGI